MARSKDLSEDLRKSIIESHKSGNGYKKISRQFGVHVATIQKIIKKWKSLKSVANRKRGGRPSKFSNRMKRKLIKQVMDNPRLTSKELQKSMASDGVVVDSSTIRKKLAENDLHGRKPRRKPLLSKKNVFARLEYAKEHLNKNQVFWENILWSDESKIELFSFNKQRYIWRKENTAY